MWYAVAITVVAATGNNVGKALQKKAVQGLPRLIMDRRVVKQYLLDRTWTLGLLSDIFGALLNVVAIAQAPVRSKPFYSRAMLRYIPCQCENSLYEMMFEKWNNR